MQFLHCVKQLFGFHYQRNMTFKFIQSEPSEYYVWENIQSQSQVSTETEDIAELKDMLQTTV